MWWYTVWYFMESATISDICLTRCRLNTKFSYKEILRLIQHVCYKIVRRDHLFLGKMKNFRVDHQGNYRCAFWRICLHGCGAMMNVLCFLTIFQDGGAGLWCGYGAGFCSLRRQLRRRWWYAVCFFTIWITCYIWEEASVGELLKLNSDAKSTLVSIFAESGTTFQWSLICFWWMCGLGCAAMMNVLCLWTILRDGGVGIWYWVWCWLLVAEETTATGDADMKSALLLLIYQTYLLYLGGFQRY